MNLIRAYLADVKVPRSLLWRGRYSTLLPSSMRNMLRQLQQPCRAVPAVPAGFLALHTPIELGVLIKGLPLAVANHIPPRYMSYTRSRLHVLFAVAVEFLFKMW